MLVDVKREEEVTLDHACMQSVTMPFFRSVKFYSNISDSNSSTTSLASQNRTLTGAEVQRYRVGEGVIALRASLLSKFFFGTAGALVVKQSKGYLSTHPIQSSHPIFCSEAP